MKRSWRQMLVFGCGIAVASVLVGGCPPHNPPTNTPGQSGGLLVEAKAGFLLFRAMTREAVSFEDRAYVSGEIHWTIRRGR